MSGKRDRKALIEKKQERSKINDTTIQGEVTSVIYRNGPIKERSFTDFYGCLIYLVFLTIGIIITVIAFQDGDINLIKTGFDIDSLKELNYHIIYI